MVELSVWDLARNLLLAARWTILLSIVAFIGGALAGLALLLVRLSGGAAGRRLVAVYVDLCQGTPLLMQLFLTFFGLPLVGIDVSPWLAAAIALTLHGGAYLGDIWSGTVAAIPAGQWDAAASLGMRRIAQLRHVILPQALRIALPPTTGFLVQLVKGTALTSVIGFRELTRTGDILTNATFRPFAVYGLVALIYFFLCFPITRLAARLERTAGG